MKRFAELSVFAAVLVALLLVVQSHKSVGAQSPGFIQVFDATGAAGMSYSCVLVQGNSTASGTFSLTYVASPRWSATPTIWYDRISVVSAGTGISTAYVPFVTSVTSTGISGVLKSGATVSVLGTLTLLPATTAAPITATVCGI